MSRFSIPFAIAAVLALALPFACAAPCPSGQIHCGDACVDLDTDVSHCGACATACPAGASCSARVCECPAGQSVCGSTCVDTSSDTANCGSCGHGCGLGTCASGACACDSTPATVANCGGSPACVDTAADQKNCGACGTACTLQDEQCSGSHCACEAPKSASCPVADPTACVDLTSDVSNCGACGDTCLTGGDCDGGACGCPATLTACPVVDPTACVNRQTDANNCGTCGTTCASGQTCQSGICCNGSICNGQCVTTSTDANNCGGCGTVCGAAAPNCISGACCGSGTTVVCSEVCCGGGTACCSSGCPAQHYNGLGGPQGATFFDCNAADSIAAAQDAAKAWSPSGLMPASEVTLTGQSCFGWTTSDTTQCAVYCATGSAAPGLVKLTLNGLGCAVPYVGDPTSMSWQ